MILTKIIFQIYKFQLIVFFWLFRIIVSLKFLEFGKWKNQSTSLTAASIFLMSI